MIYLDLDGVLADFDAAVARRGVKNRTNFIHKPKSEWTDADKDLDEQVRVCMSTEGFWENIPVMSGAHDLWTYCLPYRPVILTAKPKDAEYGPRVAKEKRAWVHKVFGDIQDDQFICCLRSEKQNFIGHTDHRLQILVDDMEINCKEWVAAGGRAVVHTSAEDTIRKLDRIIFQDESVGVVV